MSKSCFRSVMVLMHFIGLFVCFSTISGSNDLFPMKKINWPIRVNLATIGWKSNILKYNFVSSFKINLFLLSQSYIWPLYAILHYIFNKSDAEMKKIVWLIEKKLTLESLWGPHRMSKIYASFPHRSFASLYWACTIPVRPFPNNIRIPE